MHQYQGMLRCAETRVEDPSGSYHHDSVITILKPNKIDTQLSQKMGHGICFKILLAKNSAGDIRTEIGLCRHMEYRNT